MALDQYIPPGGVSSRARTNPIRPYRRMHTAIISVCARSAPHLETGARPGYTLPYSARPTPDPAPTAEPPASRTSGQSRLIGQPRCQSWFRREQQHAADNYLPSATIRSTGPSVKRGSILPVASITSGGTNVAILHRLKRDSTDGFAVGPRASRMCKCSIFIMSPILRAAYNQPNPKFSD
jgi:hypothetical protein